MGSTLKAFAVKIGLLLLILTSPTMNSANLWTSAEHALGYLTKAA